MPRTTSQPAFWNERYALDGFAFGDQPDPFIAEALLDLEARGAITVPARVADLGAGEGRHAVFAAQRGHRVTAVDFADAGLDVAQRLAADLGVDIATEVADVTRWKPEMPVDVALLGFVHMLPEERSRLFGGLGEWLRPGGWLIARWFRPEHVQRGTFGPSAVDRLMTPALIRAALPTGTIHRCEARTVVLASGRYLQGAADVVDLVWQAPG